MLHDPASRLPAVGAGGGISGVIAFYALRYPRARILLFRLAIFRPLWIELPAWLAFLLWTGFQVLGLAAGARGVAYEAHLGGAAAGALLWLPWRAR